MGDGLPYRVGVSSAPLTASLPKLLLFHSGKRRGRNFEVFPV
jgi:hypothetical protein